MNQIDKVKDIADGMIGIGGVPSNEDFYSEFNSRVKESLNIKSECKWKHMDVGMFGCEDYVYTTSCGKEFDTSKISRSNYCPNCGLPVS